MLGRDGAVGQRDPGALAPLLCQTLLVLADASLFLLKDDGNACPSQQLNKTKPGSTVYVRACGLRRMFIRPRARYSGSRARHGPRLTKASATYNRVGSSTLIHFPSFVWISMTLGSGICSPLAMAAALLASPSPIPCCAIASFRACSSWILTSCAMRFGLKRICTIASCTVLPVIWCANFTSFLTDVGSQGDREVCCLSVRMIRASRDSALYGFRPRWTARMSIFLSQRARARGFGSTARARCSRTKEAPALVRDVEGASGAPGAPGGRAAGDVGLGTSSSKMAGPSTRWVSLEMIFLRRSDGPASFSSSGVVDSVFFFRQNQ